MEKATMSVEETAKYLGIGRNKMYEMIKEGQIPHLKLGKQIRIPKSVLESWLIEKSIKS